jgi:hypothetical protein
MQVWHLLALRARMSRHVSIDMFSTAGGAAQNFSAGPFID